jgi:hypothetical protein
MTTLTTYGLSASLADDSQNEYGFQPRAFVLTNARISVAPGSSIENGRLIVRDGRVTEVGTAVEIPPGTEIIDASGLFIYPGFVDAGATGFLVEAKPKPVEGRAVDVARYALAGMRPDDHSGLTPEFSAAEHLAPKHEDQERYRQSGFVAVHVLPSGRIASGRGTVIDLATGPLRESVLRPVTFATLQSEVGTNIPRQTWASTRTCARHSSMPSDADFSSDCLPRACPASPARPPTPRSTRSPK